MIVDILCPCLCLSSRIIQEMGPQRFAFSKCMSHVGMHYNEHVDTAADASRTRLALKGRFARLSHESFYPIP